MLDPGRAIRVLATALVALGALNLRAEAQPPTSGDVYIEFVSGGFIIGAAGGSGTLTYGGKRYALSIGGVKIGPLIGLSKAELVGRAYNLNRPSDIAGTYGAAEAGYAVVSGRRVARLKNDKGVVLELRGRQVGLELSVDLSGMVISLR